MNPSSLSSHDALQALLARFGSRRALIEELDRRKRLHLLNPPAEHYVKGDRSKIKNEPNPQWRKISTPSLLIEGEILEDFIYQAPEIVIPAELISQKPQTQPKNQPRIHRERAHDPNKRCKGCGVPLDERTKGCDCCMNRHYMRRRAQRIADSKGQRDSASSGNSKAA